MENRLQLTAQAMEEERYVARLRLDEMSIKLEQSQNRAHAAADNHLEALVTLRNQKSEVDLDIVQLKRDMNALHAERNSLSQENQLLREHPESGVMEFNKLRNELAKEREKNIEMEAKWDSEMLECEANNDEMTMGYVERKVEELSEQTERFLDMKRDDFAVNLEEEREFHEQELIGLKQDYREAIVKKTN